MRRRRRARQRAGFGRPRAIRYNGVLFQRESSRCARADRGYARSTAMPQGVKPEWIARRCSRRSRLAAVASGVVVLGTAAPARRARPSPISRRPSRPPRQVCAACHGADGNSAVAGESEPRRTGRGVYQPPIAALQGGHARESRSCRAWRSRCSEPTWSRSASTISQQKPKSLAAKDPQLVAAGQKLFRGGDAASRRARMRGMPLAQRRGHSEELSRGCPASTPTTRMRSSRRSSRGERGNDADGKDANGRIMGAVAQKHDRRADEGARRLRGGLALAIAHASASHESVTRAFGHRPSASVAHRRAARLPDQGLPRHRRRARGRRSRPGSSPQGVGDREWMVVDRDGRFLTQRELPRLALVAIDVDGDGAAPRGAAHAAAARLPFDARWRLARRRRVAQRRARLDTGDAAAQWLSDWLGARRAPRALRSARTRACNPRVRRRLGRAHDVRRRLSRARHRRLRSPTSTRASPRAGTRRCR